MSDPKNPDLGTHIPLFGAAGKPKAKPRYMSHPAPPLQPSKGKVAENDLEAPSLPVGPLPSGPPVGILQSYGVQAGIQDVNNRVAKITDAHTQAFGHPPSPSLLFDILKTPGIQEPDYSKLFSVTSKRQANTLTAGGSVEPYGPQDSSMTYVRGDGLIVHPTSPSFPRSDTLTSFHKQYPTVVHGMLPLDNASDIYKADSLLSGNPQLADVVQAKGTIAAENHTNADPLPMSVTSQGMTVAQAEEIQKLRAGETGASNLAVSSEYRSAVATMQQAQVALNKMMGTKLPITGFMNPDWQKTIKNWMNSRSYYEQSAKYQAAKAGYKSYGSYLKSFQTKARAVAKHPNAAHLINALPVNVFDNGGSLWDVIKGTAEHPFADPSLSATFVGHAISRTAGEALGVVGGATVQAKSEAAAGNAFLSHVSPWLPTPWVAPSKDYGKHYSLDEAKAHFHKTLEENPTWMSIFDPSLHDGPESGILASIDQVSNLAGDLLLLRKPVFTGETVEAGDIAAAKNSSYIHAVHRYAYDYIKKDRLDLAAKVLEGGPGSDQLVAATRQSVQKGWMSPEVFHDHLTELFAKGGTRVRVLKPEKESVVPVYHGTATTEPLDAAKGSPNTSFGHAVFVTPREQYANSYAELRGDTNQGADSLAPGKTPNVRLGKVDTSKLFPYSYHGEPDSVASGVDVPRIVRRVLKKLTPQEAEIAKTLETMNLSEVQSTKTLYDYLQTLGSRMESDGVIAKTSTYGRDFANEVLQRAGYKGIEDIRNGREFAMFDAKDILPRFEQPVEIEIAGPTLDSLRDSHMPTPSALRVHATQFVRGRLAAFDRGTQKGGRLGTLAPDFSNWVSHEFSRFGVTGEHVAPSGYRGAYDPKMPERVHDFVMKHFNNRELAGKLASDLIRARAFGNTPRIDKIENQLHRLYYAKYPEGRGSLIEDDPFMPLLESEAGSRFYFPSGNFQRVNNPLNPFSWLPIGAARVNAALNTVGAKLRRIMIIAPSLFYKHAVADTARAIVGGDPIVLGAEDKAALNDIMDLANKNPEVARRWGTMLDRVTHGESHYMTTPGEKTETFDTGDMFNHGPYMSAAGQYLRVMLDDKALAAYRASFPTDVTPLVRLIENNRVYRRLWSGRQKEAAVAKYGQDAMTAKRRIVVSQGNVGVQTRAEMMSDAYPSQAMAAEIYNRYKRIDDAAQAQGTSLSEALNILKDNRGAKADEALGKWISDNGVDFKVEKGLVHNGFAFDALTSKAVQKIMAPNKWNRGRMARNITAIQYRKLVASGMDKENALNIAMSVAEKQTVYHLLDFSNMLQIEQDLRWLSFFATKHRLYWKWVADTMVRNPGAALFVQDFKQHLDNNGNLNLPTILGNKWAIPAARLLWVNSKEYPEESPFAGGLKTFLAEGFNIQAGANAIAGSLGSGISRDAVPAQLMFHYAEMEAGLRPSTYSFATSGMDATNKRYFTRVYNHFQMDYQAEHGHYPSEATATKYALLHYSAETMWRGNLPLPVIGQSNPTNNPLLNQFEKIIDPQKRSAFLDKHPEVAALFGVSKNPLDYAHNRKYWSKYTIALDHYHAAREEIYQEAKKLGYMSPELTKQRSLVGQKFQEIRDGLIADDLRATAPGRWKEINGEKYGIWGQQVTSDPLAMGLGGELKKLFPNLSQESLKSGLPSQLIAQAQLELKNLKNPAYVLATFQDATGEGKNVSSSEARTRSFELLQFIQDFQPYAHDHLGKLDQKYVQKYVNPYWNQVDKMNAYIKKVPNGQKGLLYAQLRDWKDQQNQAVTVDGIKFPPPLIAAWQNLPKTLYDQRISQIATGSWSNLADYEKQLLGVKVGEYVSHGWSALDQWRAEEHAKGYTITKAMQAQAVSQIEAKIPGFKEDYQRSLQPRVQTFEEMNVYKDMPKNVRTFWDAVISKNAHAVAKVYNEPNISNRKDIKLIWDKAVNVYPTKAMPEVGELAQAILAYPPMMKWLQPYLTAKPDFLNTLIEKSSSANG